MKNRQCNSGREGEGREGKKVRVCCGLRVGGSQIFEQWSYQNVYMLSPMCSCELCLNSHVISNFTCRLLLRTNSLCFTTIKSFNPSVGKALPKCRAIAPFLFPSQYHCVVWVSALPQNVVWTLFLKVQCLLENLPISTDLFFVSMIREWSDLCMTSS